MPETQLFKRRFPRHTSHEERTFMPVNNVSEDIKKKLQLKALQKHTGAFNAHDDASSQTL